MPEQQSVPVGISLCGEGWVAFVRVARRFASPEPLIITVPYVIQKASRLNAAMDSLSHWCLTHPIAGSRTVAARLPRRLTLAQSGHRGHDLCLLTFGRLGEEHEQLNRETVHNTIKSHRFLCGRLR